MMDCVPCTSPLLIDDENVLWSLVDLGGFYNKKVESDPSILGLLVELLPLGGNTMNERVGHKDTGLICHRMHNK
jgi:hypothetical protein